MKAADLNLPPLSGKFNSIFKEVLKKTASESQARRNPVKKRSLHEVNEHFELDFNAAWPSAAVFQSFLNRRR
jgi:hypothetical protein